MHTNCPQCRKLNDPSVLVCPCGNELVSPLQMEPGLQPARQAPPLQFDRETASLESPVMPEQSPPPSAEQLLQERREQAVRRLIEEEASNSSSARKPPEIAYRLKVKKILVLASFVLVMGAVLAVFGGFVDLAGVFSGEEEQQQERATSLADTDPALLRARPNAANNPAGENILEGEVTDVLSGDTIRITGTDNEQYTVKLEGIDAPEAEQPFGTEAKRNLSALTFGKNVRLVRRTVNEDGTVIGKVILGGANMNLAQLRSGLAWYDTSVNFDQSENDSYAYAETVAKRSKFGLWSDPNPQPPWEYRSKTNQKQAETPLVAVETNDAAPKAAPKAKTIERETTRRIENETTVAQTAPTIDIQTPPDAIIPPSPPKVNAVPIPEGYERKTTFISRNATARCADGTMSFSATRSGSCSTHGGVAEWLGANSNAPAAKTYTRPRYYTLGPRGGCYFVSNYGKKMYVDRELCAK